MHFFKFSSLLKLENAAPEIGSAFCSLAGEYAILPLKYMHMETLFLHYLSFSSSQPTLLGKGTSPAYSAPRAHQQGTSTALSQPAVKHGGGGVSLSSIPADSASAVQSI